MMPEEKYFPVFFVRETYGMMSEMPAGINGRIITVAPIYIRPDISRIVNGTKNAAVGQRPSGDLSILCAPISTLGKRKAVFYEILDDTVGAFGSTACLGQGETACCTSSSGSMMVFPSKP